MTARLRLWVRFPLVLLCIFVTLLLMGLCTLAGARRLNRKIMCASFRTGAVLFGLRIHTQGTLSTQRPLLLISNHFSYLDLFAIGSFIPAAFTPKSEIAGWPVIGALSKMAGCFFIDRRPGKTLESRNKLEQAKTDGDVISLFPEGTTNEGTALLPFKSSYFSLAEHNSVAVQPLSIVYTHLNGMPITAYDLPVVGWFGDATLFPHVVQFLKQKNADVTLVFHTAVTGSHFASRKDLAKYCKKQVEQSLTIMLPRIFVSPLKD